MECRNVQDKLNLYVEDLLSPQDQEMISHHVSGCSKCSDALKELKNTISLLKDLDRIEPPPWLASKIIAHIEDEAESRHGLLSWMFRPFAIKLPIQALALVLIVGLSVLLYRANVAEFELTRPSVQKQSEKSDTKTAPERSLISPDRDTQKLTNKSNLPSETQTRKTPTEERLKAEKKEDKAQGILKQEAPQLEYERRPPSEVMKIPEPLPPAAQTTPAAPASPEMHAAPSQQMRASQSIPEPTHSAPATGGSTTRKKEVISDKQTPFNSLSETKPTRADDVLQKGRSEEFRQDQSVGTSKDRLYTSNAPDMVEKILTSLNSRQIKKEPSPNGLVITAQVPSESIAALTEKLSSYPHIKIIPDKSAQQTNSGFYTVRIEITTP